MKAGLLIGACLLFTTPIWAQSTGERSGVNSTFALAPKTSDFVTEVAQSDMFEIESSKLAASKAQGDVKAFANQMVTDHTKTTSELKPLAQAVHITPPTQMSSDQRSKLDKLRAANGKDFTNLFIDNQVETRPGLTGPAIASAAASARPQRPSG